MLPAANSSYDPYVQVWSYPVAGIIIAISTYIASTIIRRGRQSLKGQGQVQFESGCKEGNYEGGFWDLIRESDYFPSLARFQFMIWTFVISFTIISIYLLMLGNHTLCWSTLPSNILLLMGISAAVPLISSVISREKYSKEISGLIPCKEKAPAFSTILLEHSKPTVGRYQMFLWTIISVIIYLSLFIQELSGIHDMGNLVQLRLPDIDISLLFLMGLSQAAYVGAKLTSRSVSSMTIIGTYPAKNQQNVKRSTSIIVTFSKPIDSATIDNTSFDVRKQGSATGLPGSVKVLPEDEEMAMFDPTNDLEADTIYNVTILKRVRSKDKTELGQDETWFFTTGK